MEVVSNLLPIGRHVTLRKKIPWFWLKTPQNSHKLAADVVAFWKLSGLLLVFPQGCSVYVTLAKEQL